MFYKLKYQQKRICTYMSILFFVEALIYTVFTILLSTSTVNVFAATVTWRIMGAVSIFGLVLSIYFQLPIQNKTFIFLSLLQCFVLVPLFSPFSVCHICGKRIYWKPLISKHCQHCGEILYKQKF